jgi:RimJ/RimL family protein N-acetyltransferase
MHLATARLTLRALSLDDLDFVAAMVADPVVMRYYPKLLSRTEALGWSLPGLITWCSA